MDNEFTIPLRCSDSLLAQSQIVKERVKDCRLDIFNYLISIYEYFDCAFMKFNDTVVSNIVMNVENDMFHYKKRVDIRKTDIQSVQ